MSVREELATAAGTVPGVTAHPYFVQSTAAGTVWIRLERIDYPNPFGGVVRWNVVLVLPQDQAQAERELERLAPLLRTALEPHLAIDSVEPQRLDLQGIGIVPVAFINGHREEV